MTRNTCFKLLASNFRVIAFDNFSNGSNTKLDSCSGLGDDTKAFKCIIDWYDAFFAAIDHILPEKFCLFAVSSCGYTMGLWAAQNPHRIESLFLGSPAGTEIGPNSDKYKRRTQTEKNVYTSKQIVDLWIFANKNSNWLEYMA